MSDPVFIAVPHGIEAMVCTEIAARQSKGIAKYGTTVADNPLSLRQWLQHAYEEALDQAIYLKRAIAEIDAQELRDLDDMVELIPNEVTAVMLDTFFDNNNAKGR